MDGAKEDGGYSSSPSQFSLVPFILTSVSFLEVVMFEGLFQPTHLVVILFIALLVFGPKKLPELGKGLGDGIRSFKDSMREKEQSAEEKKQEARMEI
jgi:sec-independent protein translocase protein TatA